MNVFRCCRLMPAQPTPNPLTSVSQVLASHDNQRSHFFHSNNNLKQNLHWRLQNQSLSCLDCNRRTSPTAFALTQRTHESLKSGTRNVSFFRHFVHSRLPSNSTQWHYPCVKQFRTKTKPGSLDSNLDHADKVLSQLKHEEESLDINAGWLIRLANENGYLSWCRNVYISTVAGATIYTQGALVPYAKEAGVLLLLMGGLNMAIGTSTFVYNIIHLRSKMMMGRLMSLTHILGAIIHLSLWFGCMAIYLGYVEEIDDEEDSPENVRLKEV